MSLDQIKDLNVLVTGADGFIGSHLIERLINDGVSVTVIDDFNDFYDPAIKRANIAKAGQNLHVVEGDICDAAVLDKAFNGRNYDAVVHLAARAGVRPSREYPELYLRTNINGTFRLLEAIKKAGTPKLIFASSSSVYGLNKKLPFSELDRIDQTISPYAATKLAGEQLCSTYAHLNNIRTVCLRFFTVYGPRQRPDLAISKFTRLINEGKPIPKFGDGSSATALQWQENGLAYGGLISEGATAGAFTTTIATFFDINSGKYKSFYVQNAADYSGAGKVQMTAGTYKKQEPITSILFKPDAGDVLDESRIDLFGILPRMVS